MLKEFPETTDLIGIGDVSIEYRPTGAMIADYMTKRSKVSNVLKIDYEYGIILTDKATMGQQECVAIYD